MLLTWTGNNDSARKSYIWGMVSAGLLAVAMFIDASLPVNTGGFHVFVILLGLVGIALVIVNLVMLLRLAPAALTITDDGVWLAQAGLTRGASFKDITQAHYELRKATLSFAFRAPVTDLSVLTSTKLFAFTLADRQQILTALNQRVPFV